MRKRILAIVMVLCLMMTMMPGVAWAADNAKIFTGNTDLDKGIDNTIVVWTILSGGSPYGQPPYTWTATGLPAGLMLENSTSNENNGEIKIIGKVNTAGVYSVTLEVSDSTTPKNVGTKEIYLNVWEKIDGLADYDFLPITSGITRTYNSTDGKLTITIPVDGKAAIKYNYGGTAKNYKFENTGTGAATIVLDCSNDVYNVTLDANASLKVTVGSTPYVYKNGSDTSPAEFSFSNINNGFTLNSGSIVPNGKLVRVGEHTYLVEDDAATVEKTGDGVVIKNASSVDMDEYLSNQYMYTFNGIDTNKFTMTVSRKDGKDIISIKYNNVINNIDENKPHEQMTFDSTEEKYKLNYARKYNLYIEDKQVTDDYLTGSGWSYNPADNILTLNSATLSLAGKNVGEDEVEHAAAIHYYYYDDISGTDTLTIELSGDNVVSSGNSNTGWASAIEVVNASLIIKEKDGSTGKLTVKGGVAGDVNYGSAGIRVGRGNLTINSGIIIANANGGGQYNTYNHGITAGGNIEITGTSKVTAESNGDGIWLEGNNQTITIRGKAEVNATGNGTGEDNGIGGNPGSKLVILDEAKVIASAPNGNDPDFPALAIKMGTVEIYSGDYNIETKDISGKKTVKTRISFNPATHKWDETTYFKMPSDEPADSSGGGGGGYVPPVYRVYLPTGESYTAAPEPGYYTTVLGGSTFKFGLNIMDGYMAGADFAVKTNGSQLLADPAGIYTIGNIWSDQYVTVDGVELIPEEPPAVEPVEPEEPETPAGEPEEEKPAAGPAPAAPPETGDSGMDLWLVMMLLSMAGIAVLAADYRRKSAE